VIWFRLIGGLGMVLVEGEDVIVFCLSVRRHNNEQIPVLSCMHRMLIVSIARSWNIHSWLRQH